MTILPKVGLDLDGVLVSFHDALINTYNQRYNGNLSINDLDGELENLGSDLLKKVVEIFNEPNWFIDLLPLPDAINIVSNYVDLEYEVMICTAPARDLNGLTNPSSASEKFLWIRRWLPFWANNVIITRHKALIDVDILIDDTGHNIVNWCKEHPNGIGYLVDQPWNRNFNSFAHNAVRGSLENSIKFIKQFWCQERGKFVYRLDELQNWKNR